MYQIPAALSEHNDLEQLKRQAKDLQKAVADLEPAAIELVRQHERSSATDSIQLTTAQLVIARHHGFPNWEKLRADVDRVTLKRLKQAVENGNTREVRELLRRRPELVKFPMAENDEHRLIHFAVFRRDVPMVRALMQAGANPHAGIYPYREPSTALQLAKEREFHDVVAAIEEEEQYRRESMSCPNATISPAQDELIALLRNHDEAAAIALLEKDSSLGKACDREGRTALHAACEEHLFQVIDWLFEHHANPRKESLNGKAPLDCAVLHWKAKERLSTFPRVAHKLIRHGARMTPRIAAALGDLEFLRDASRRDPASMQNVPWGESSLLSICVAFKQTEALKLLLELGHDPDEPTPLQGIEGEVPSAGGPILGCCWNYDYDLATILLEHGANPNAQVYATGTAANWATNMADERMIELLAKYGGQPSPYVIGANRNLAAARQLLAERNDPAVVQELFGGAASGGSPEIMELCLAEFPDQDLTRNPRTPLGAPLSQSNHAPYAKRPEAFDRSTYPECLRIMLSHGADVNAVDGKGHTLMHRIAASGDCWGLKVMTESERLEFARVALAFSPDLTLRDNLLKSTPLAWACRWGRVELVKLLLDHGAAVEEPEAEHWATPMAWATKMGQVAVAELLRSRILT